jgi:hypothetical protein
VGAGTAEASDLAGADLAGVDLVVAEGLGVVAVVDLVVAALPVMAADLARAEGSLVAVVVAGLPEAAGVDPPVAAVDTGAAVAGSRLLPSELLLQTRMVEEAVHILPISCNPKYRRTRPEPIQGVFLKRTPQTVECR